MKMESAEQVKRLAATLRWIKNDLAFKAPEQVDPDINERYNDAIDAALEEAGA